MWEAAGPDRRLDCAKPRESRRGEVLQSLEMEVVEVGVADSEALQKWNVGVLRELRLTGGVAETRHRKDIVLEILRVECRSVEA